MRDRSGFGWLALIVSILLVLLVTEYLSIHAELSETLKSYRKPARADRPSATSSPAPED